MSVYPEKHQLRQLLPPTGLPTIDQAAADLLRSLQQISEDSDHEDTPREAKARIASGYPSHGSQHHSRTREGRQKEQPQQHHCVPSLPRINAPAVSRGGGERLRNVGQSMLQQDQIKGQMMSSSSSWTSKPPSRSALRDASDDWHQPSHNSMQEISGSWVSSPSKPPPSSALRDTSEEWNKQRDRTRKLQFHKGDRADEHVETLNPNRPLATSATSSLEERKIRDELSALRLAHNETLDQLAQAKQQLTWAQTELQLREPHPEPAAPEHCPEEVASLKALVSRAQAEREQYKAEVRRLQDQNQSMESAEARLARAMKDIKRLKEEVEDTKSSLSRVRADRDKHKTELQHLKEQSRPLEDFQRQSEKLEEARATLSRAMAEKDEFMSELRRLKKQNRATAHAEEELLSMQKRFQAQKEELDSLREERALELRRRKEKSLADIKVEDKLSKLQQNFEKQSEEVGALRRKLKDHEDLKHEAQSLKAELATKKQELEAASAVTQQQEAQLRELRRKGKANCSPTASDDQEEIAKLRAELAEEARAHRSTAQGLDAARAASQQKEVVLQEMRNKSQTQIQTSSKEMRDENEALRKEVREKTLAHNRLEDEQEKVVNDYSAYINRFINSSARPVLDGFLDMSAAELIGMGHYGYIMTSRSKESNEKLVVKLQSVRWVHVAVKEWAHGSGIGAHANIVEAKEVCVHSDADHSIQARLIAGFESGAIVGKRPKWFPNAYLCMVQEYMDRGSVESLIEKHLLTLEGACAITRQVSSALAFMHRKKRTHNDIKPENILLKRSPDGKSLLVKLADMGMAEHSVERTRDRELLAYTIWCIVLGRTFSRCPAKDGRPQAIAEMQRAPLLGHRATAKGTTLIQAVDGLWNEKVDVAEIASMAEFDGCEVREPEGQEMRKHLKECAHEMMVRRANHALDRFRFVAQKARLTVNPLSFDTVAIAALAGKRADASLEHASEADSMPAPTTRSNFPGC